MLFINYISKHRSYDNFNIFIKIRNYLNINFNYNYICIKCI